MSGPLPVCPKHKTPIAPDSACSTCIAVDRVQSRVDELESLVDDIKRQSQRCLDPKSTIGPGPYGTLEYIVGRITDDERERDE